MSFWQTEVQQRCFSAWRNARNAQLEKAETLRRKQLLQKGLKALKFAISQQRQTVSELKTKSATRVMAKYWLKVVVLQKRYYKTCMLVCTQGMRVLLKAGCFRL